MATKIICERLIAPTAVELEQIRHIYETNFPAAERKPFDYFGPRIVSGNTICMVVRREDEPERIIAFAFLLQLPNMSLVFLEYVAVDKAAQGMGVGSQFFSAFKEMGSGVVWEVEPPTTAPDAAPNRRIRFYERLGAKFIDLSTPYVMPNYASPGEGVPLLLMQLPLEKQPNRQEFRAIVKGIYDVAYPEWGDLRDRILERLGESF